MFTTADITHIMGFTKRQLDYWSQQGVIVPSIQRSHGPGSRRLYSLDDLLQLRFIRQLKHHGWSTQKIRLAIETLRIVMNDPDPLKNAVVFHSKGTILALCKTKAGERILLDALNTGGQQVMCMVIETLTEELQLVADLSSDKAVTLSQPGINNPDFTRDISF